MRLFSFFFFSLLAVRAAGQDVRIIEQKFDFREFRFDITLESSEPGIKLTDIGLYTWVRLCEGGFGSGGADITIKSMADYQIALSWEAGKDTVSIKTGPVLELSKNISSRFTLGFIAPPTALFSEGCLQLTARPVLSFSDGSRLVLEEEVLDSEDFLDYERKRIPTNEQLLHDLNSSKGNIKENSARMLCKTTLPKTILKPLLDSLIQDHNSWVRASAIISAGRLGYSEYVPLLEERFVKTTSPSEASACLRALDKLDSISLIPMVLGRFDTSRMSYIVNTCCWWLDLKDPERSSYQNVLEKLSGESPLQVKLACLPVVAAWKINEAVDLLLAMLVNSEFKGFEEFYICRTLRSLDAPSIGPKAYDLLLRHRQLLSQPEQNSRYRALLQIVVDCRYRPALALITELLQPGQPATTLSTALTVLIRRRATGALNRRDTTQEATDESYFEALKPSVLRLTTHPEVKPREEACRLYCHLARPGDMPSCEDIVRNFFQSETGSGQELAIGLIANLKLNNLAPDLCALLKKTTDESFRSQLEGVLKYDLNYRCP